jgi:hypothetical protein
LAYIEVILVQSNNRHEIYIPNDDTSLHCAHFYTIQEYETGRSLLIGTADIGEEVGQGRGER